MALTQIEPAGLADGAFTLGSASQFKEVARSSGTQANNTFFTAYSVGGTEDGMWLVYVGGPAHDNNGPYAACWFFSTKSGDMHAVNTIDAGYGGGQWSGDNIQMKVSNDAASSQTAEWVVYQLQTA